MFTLTREISYEEEIKKSRFIAKATPVNDNEAALAYLERIREAKATHNCWAYRIGQKYRFSDDGEPTGTAGRPILNAIEKQEVDHVIVVVIRYFGGIKLGAGGLVRAYGGCAAKCLQSGTFEPVIPTMNIQLKVGFEDIGALYPIIDRFGAEKLSESYTEKGLLVTLRIKQSDRQALLAALTDTSAGRIKVFNR